MLRPRLGGQVLSVIIVYYVENELVSWLVLVVVLKLLGED